MLEAVKIIVSLVVIVPIISKLFDIFNYNDLDVALSLKAEQQINKILNIISLFICSVMIILFGSLIVYGKVELTETFATVINIIEIVALVILICIYVIIKPKMGSKLYWLEKNKLKITVGFLIFNWICSIMYILVYALPTNLILDNTIIISIIAVFFSIYTIQICGMINNKPRESKFYYYEENTKEKNYIYYVQKDNYVVCGAEKVFNDSKKYKCMLLTELKDKHEIIRDEMK